MIDKSDISEFLLYRGRVAQSVILKALGIGSGDQIAIQAFTCLAVPEGVYASGAKPLYIDIEKNGYNMCPDALEKNITSETKAIIVQHTYGIPAQINKITDIANKQGIPVIEDCCHTLEGMYQDKKLGTFGVASFYSFEWGKPIAAGLGGAIAINDPALKSKITEITSDFSVPTFTRRLKIELQYQAFSLLYRPKWFWPVRSAFRTLSRLGAAEGNFHDVDEIIKGDVPDFSMKMAPSVKKRMAKKISMLEQITSHSKKITDFYGSEITSEQVIHPVLPDNSKVIFARYPMRTEYKQELLKKAMKDNVEIADWYSTPIHPIPPEQAYAVGYIFGSCPNAEKRAKEIISLPTHLRVKDSYLRKVKKFLNHSKDE
jgi:dTDP-4-amino-4,6-dideoxygalactose transaminase